MAVDDSFAVVGATGGGSILPGEVHVFKRGVGGWVHETQLIPSIHPGPTFGCTVAISGERIVIGNCSSNETTVVFERISGEWLETAVLPAIGRAVALDDDVAVVGDFLSREVLVFRYSGSEWKMEDRLFIDTYQWYYGFAVAVDSNRIAVGAPLANDFFDASGSAYVYSFNGSEWLLNARLLPSQPRLYGRFGYSVAIADERLAIGAPGESGQTGAIYIFGLGEEGWNEQSRLVPPDPNSGSGFSFSVAFSGKLVVGGAYHDNEKANLAGAAHVFQDGPGGWKYVTKLTSVDAEQQEYYGISVDTDGSTILIGANGYSGPAESTPASGSLWLYEGFDGQDGSRLAVPIQVRVFLEGAYIKGSSAMSTALNSAGFLEVGARSQPYSPEPWGYANHDSVAAGFFGSNPEIVDWVYLRAYSGNSVDSLVQEAETVGFLKSDGTIVGLDGNSPVAFNLPNGQYFVAVYHRNHIPVISATPVDFGTPTPSYDFTDSVNKAYTKGGAAMKDLGDGNFGMFACDPSADGQITALDFTIWITSTTAGQSGYQSADCNLDGLVTALDFGLWIQNTTAGAGSRIP